MTREEAIDVLKLFLPSTCSTDLCETVEIAIQTLSAESTADVRENVRGEWIDCGVHGEWAWEQDGHGNFWHIWKCSKCEHTTDNCSKYCPNCGADMRGKA